MKLGQTMQTGSQLEWGNEDTKLVAFIDGELDEATRPVPEARVRRGRLGSEMSDTKHCGSEGLLTRSRG
jgi:hypothetical protein